MKYQFRIRSINPETTHGKVLSQVRPGSRVLECGSAEGYMTEYLRNGMGCRVSVVEVDQEGFQKSMQYADDGYRGSLTEDGCWEHFRGKQFDCILFADVLEHLTDPMKAVRSARELLTDDGIMVISIPNVCHNDIIIRMLCDSFTYTSMGLLDNTHVHFWGFRDFMRFLKDAGMVMTKVDEQIMMTGTTEQRVNLEGVDKSLLAVLRSHTLGEVYQFIVTCKKRGAGAG